MHMNSMLTLLFEGGLPGGEAWPIFLAPFKRSDKDERGQA